MEEEIKKLKESLTERETELKIVKRERDETFNQKFEMNFEIKKLKVTFLKF